MQSINHKRTFIIVRGRFRSFGFAVQGVKVFWQQPNAKIHMVVGAAVFTAAYYRHLSPDRLLWLIVVVALVLIAEALNTALEKLSDYACGSNWHPLIKSAKDVAALAVLIAAFASIAIGSIVFFF